MSDKTLEQLMTVRFELTKDIRNLEAETKDLKKERDSIDNQIIELLDNQGVDSSKIKGLGSVTVARNTVPTVEDWDSFYTYVRENDAMYLLQRRISTKPIAELMADGEKVPGIGVFEQVKLNARAS